MDLNYNRLRDTVLKQGWLPRGAMDLNPFRSAGGMPKLRLAPSWSHGSKYDVGRLDHLQIRWLPRGAMDLNP